VSGALVVFAKQPLPGQVKTRLCPPFTPEQAADFYACMLEDVLETTLRASAALGLVTVLELQPPEAVPPSPLSAGSRCEPQRARISGAHGACYARELTAGHGTVLLRGSDSPMLQQETLSAALAAPERSDLAITARIATVATTWSAPGGRRPVCSPIP
jgi:glycosyltransferase A (GT-A) superfamily protein (DUF2064 family)